MNKVVINLKGGRKLEIDSLLYDLLIEEMKHGSSSDGLYLFNWRTDIHGVKTDCSDEMFTLWRTS